MGRKGGMRSQQKFKKQSLTVYKRIIHIIKPESEEMEVRWETVLGN